MENLEIEEFIIEDYYGEGEVGEIIEIIGEEEKDKVKKKRKKANLVKYFCNKCKKTHAKKCKPCEFCKENFPDLATHKRHCRQNPHLSNNVITCETCKMKMHFRSIPAHAERCKRYGCSYCKRRYKDVDQLAAHISNFHDRERPTCDYCGLQSMYLSAMNTHMR
jgi:hypothetical protein